jgi:hypothetical protein
VRILLRFVTASLLSAPAFAQPAGVVDEASFTFTRAGAPYGTESFKIVRRLGAEGTEYVAQCTRTTEGRIVRTALTTDSAGSPTSYSRATTGTGQGQLTARRATNRLTVNEEGAQASSRDFVFSPGTLILDEDVIHQLYFVTWRDGRNFGFVSPGEKASGEGALTEVGRETLSIGSTSVSAVHYEFGSGASRREIWVDSGRRLLKVAQPGKEIVGVRDLPPR